ncbi:MAG TPA: hypothetical protein VNG12_01955 [Acidimicrobiales bacterium]|nr:hypothetical protein [Acidimicrobiales bacterium]
MPDDEQLKRPRREIRTLTSDELDNAVMRLVDELERHWENTH